LKLYNLPNFKLKEIIKLTLSKCSKSAVALRPKEKEQEDKQ